MASGLLRSLGREATCCAWRRHCLLPSRGGICPSPLRRELRTKKASASAFSDDAFHEPFSDEISVRPAGKRKSKKGANAEVLAENNGVAEQVLFSDDQDVNSRRRSKKQGAHKTLAAAKPSVDEENVEESPEEVKPKRKTTKKQKVKAAIKARPEPFFPDPELLQLELHRLKSEVFGLSSPFREHQYEAMISASCNRHVLCVVPTGTGKSLIYQIPALLKSPLVPANSGPTVVISPLKALIDDQLKGLALLPSVKAAAVHGDIDFKDKKSTMQRLPFLDVLLVTPELITNSPRWLEALKDARARRFVFDEAHCVVDWGETFRPAYKKVSELLREQFPTVPWTLLTATAPPNVKQALEDLVGTPDLLDSFVAQSSLRENLHFRVRRKPKTEDDAMNLLKDELMGSERALVYCQTRSECDLVSQTLPSLLGEPVVSAYHGGMSASAKKANWEQWRMGVARVMVATSAFGMGVHLNNVRKVVHYSMPLSLSDYVQQCGRAGRDGLSASCVLLFNEKGAAVARYMGESSNIREEVDEIISFCRSSECVKGILASKLGSETNEMKCPINCDCREVE